MDNTRLFLKGLPDSVTEEVLLLFIDNCTQKEEDPDIVYGEVPGTAMATYKDEIEGIFLTILFSHLCGFALCDDDKSDIFRKQKEERNKLLSCRYCCKFLQTCILIRLIQYIISG